jgi:predicted HTH transcriptional regulator
MEKKQLMFTNIDELRDWLIHVHEKYIVELKTAQELPSAFWETYSSFCNTAGGIIVLGVNEGEKVNEIKGVGNVAKTITSLWDQLNNKNKVSYKGIENEDVHEYKLDDKTTVILVYVKEALDRMKPVYINNKIENTWIRTGDGDRKATKEEIAAFLRNAQPSQDDIVLGTVGMDALDMDSVLAFKEKVNKRYPKQKYLEMNNEKFLVEIGGGIKDQASGEFRLKMGTLLFFGRVNAIREVYPHYHVDYFNRRGNNPRWMDRVTDDEPGEYQMNIYNFFTIVYAKLSILLQQSFELDSYQLRMPLTDFDETIRECLVNCLAHADYVQGYPSTKIEVFDGWFRFVNPGKMLISPNQFAIGGDSRPRNEIIMKYFRLLGASERQGFGGPLIYKTAMTNDFRHPEILTDIEHTELKVWNIDLADSYPELTNDEKLVLKFILKNEDGKSLREIAPIIGVSEYRVRKATTSLEFERHIIKKVGNGRATRYVLEHESVEMLTRLQMTLEELKRHI